MAEKETLPLDRIATESTQARAVISETVIGEYAEALERGDAFPPIDVYYDGEAYWLADGFHRLRAAARVGQDTIVATVHPGGKREALLHALGANETHGHRRTDADRRHAVTLMLNDPEWQLWNNSEIARQCHVSEHLVRLNRRELEPARETKATPEPARKVTRGGKTYTMRTGKIGGATPRKPKTSAVVTALPTHAPRQATSARQEPTPASSTWSKIDAPTTEMPQEHTMQSVSAEPSDVPPEPHADASAPATNVEPTVTLERSTQPPPAAEPQIESDADRRPAVAPVPDIPQEALAAIPSPLESDVPTTATSPEPIVTREEHTEALAASDQETQPDAAPPALAVGQREDTATDTPLRPSTLAEAWDGATPEQRHAFVAQYRDVLQIFLAYLPPIDSTPDTTAKPEKRAATPRATPQPQKQQKQRSPRVPAKNPR